MARKLPMIVGAGASVDVGRPGVAEMLADATRSHFPLEEEAARGLYDAVAESIARY